MKLEYKKIFSKKNLKPIVNFGVMPLANGFKTKNEIKKKEYTFRLKLGFNKKLNLVQLYENPKPKQMFNEKYAFLSSTSKGMIKHFRDYSKDLKNKIKKKNFSVLEVGCNDGILLYNFKKQKHLGIEPSKNVCELAKKKGLNVLNYFFNRKLIKKKELKNKYDIICGANVFCHIPDLNEMFFTLSKLLREKGIIAIEEPYLGDMIAKTSYDQIYDEHIYMFSISSISKIAELYGLEVFDAIPQKTHGGSMRYYLSFNSHRKKSARLNRLIKLEKKNGLDNYKKLKKFEDDCKKSRENTINKIIKYSKKHKIYGYGATSKSTTILNYCKITKKNIIAFFDNSFTKIDKYTPLTHIPILDYDSNFDKINPKICFLFAWNHADEICKKELNKLKKGMRFITHVNKNSFKLKKYFL